MNLEEFRVVIEMLMLLVGFLIGRYTCETPVKDYLKMGTIFGLFALLLILAATSTSFSLENRLKAVENVIYEVK